MEIENLKKLIKEGLSQREICLKLNTSQTNLRYWLNKFNIKTKKNKFNKLDIKKIKSLNKECPKCKEIKKITDFYQRSSGGREHEVGGYCKKCSNIYHVERIKKTKIKMIEYKGGKCVECKKGLEEYHYSVFDFHHVNSKNKDPNFNKIKYQSWEKIKIELNKCVLVCSNCHRTIHAKLHENNIIL